MLETNDRSQVTKFEFFSYKYHKQRLLYITIRLSYFPRLVKNRKKPEFFFAMFEPFFRIMAAAANCHRT